MNTEGTFSAIYLIEARLHWMMMWFELRHLVCSLAPGDDAIAKPKPPGEENGDLADSSHDVHVVELANDVLTAGPSDTMVNGSQNSSSLQHEELSQEFSQPIADQPSTAQASDTPQKGRKSRGNSRRGRGKGK